MKTRREQGFTVLQMVVLDPEYNEEMRNPCGIRALNNGDILDPNEAYFSYVDWVLDQADGTLRKIAEVTSPDTDRVMEVYTDLPGVQFYAGNCIMPTTGKGGVRYGARDGLCLGTQYYPDTANKPEFPSAVFGPDRPYRTTTVYKFRT